MIAILREVGLQVSRGEPAQVPRIRIDVKLARKQHAQLAEALASLGVRIEFIAASI